MLDAHSGKLERRPLRVDNDDRALSGLPISGASSPDGRWAYALYDGDEHQPFLLALDTASGRVIRVDLPGLERLAATRQPGRKHLGFPYLLKLRLDPAGHNLAVYPRSLRSGRVPPHADPLLSVDVAKLTSWREPAPATASGFLSFATTPRRPGNLVERAGVVGHSLEGRPIRLRQYGGPRFRGRVLVIACVHGDECAGQSVAPLRGGCPEPNANVFVVSSLNPDGSAAATRLNGRGVDLNRNFPSQWRPRGQPGTPEYSGPRPFSEPETRLAARIVNRLRPRVTIWLHQIRNGGPFVRAWGRSAAAGRLFAHLAHIPFHPCAGPPAPGRTGRTIAFPAAPPTWSSCRAERSRRGSPGDSTMPSTGSGAGRRGWAKVEMLLRRGEAWALRSRSESSSGKPSAVPAMHSPCSTRRTGEMPSAPLTWSCTTSAAAEDIAQEAFLAAVDGLDRFDRRRPFAPWLHRIVINRAIDWGRREALRRGAGDPEQSPAAVHVDEPTAGELMPALAQLPPEQRAVVVLRYLLEYTPGEIARMLEMPGARSTHASAAASTACAT